MLDAADIQRLLLGHFTAPEGHPLVGKQVVVTAFLVRHPQGPFLFDTGMAQTDPETEARYQAVRRPLAQELARHGVRLGDIKLIANCHLHFDHAGGNYLFGGIPILCQRPELDAVQRPNYTLPAAVADFPDARFEVLDGEGQVLPGLRIVPTPGHTDGHQSLVVETKQGRVILAGQAFTSATEHAIAGAPHADYPIWIDRFAELDPWRVLFAHDLAIWERGT